MHVQTSGSKPVNSVCNLLHQVALDFGVGKKFDIAFSLSESIPDRGDWKPEGEIVDGVVKTAQGGGDGKEIGC